MNEERSVNSMRRQARLISMVAALCGLWALLAVPAEAQTCGGTGNTGCGRGSASQSSPNGSTGAGNPFSLVSGNKYAEVQDYALPGVLSVEFTRHYNSIGESARAFGGGWTHGFETRLTRENPTGIEQANSAVIRVVQGDGRAIVFRATGEVRDGVRRYYSKPAGFGVIEEKVADIERALRAQATPQLLQTIGPELRPWVWRWNDGRRIVFDIDGLMQSISDADGDRLILVHDARGRLSTVSDRAGRQLRLSYWEDAAQSLGRYERESQSPQATGSTGKLRRLALPDGNAVEYFYDGVGLLSLVRYADGRELRYEYAKTKNGWRLSKVLDRERQVLARYEYDDSGYGKATQRGEGVDAVRLEYRSTSQGSDLSETWIKNAHGESTLYRWRVGADLQEWQLVEAYGPGCASCAPSNVRYRYDRHGLIDRVEWLQEGPASEQRREVLRAERYERDALARLTAKFAAERDASGRLSERLVERYVYRTDDPLERPARIERPSVNAGALSTLEFTYNARGQATQLIETGFTPSVGLFAQYTPIKRTTQFAYYEAADGNAALVGRLKLIDGPLPGASDSVRYTYDERGLLTRVSYASGAAETYEYDDLARLRVQTPRDGIAVAVEYDEFSRPVAFTRAGIRSVLGYDVHGRLAVLADAVGQRFRLGYDSADRLTTIADTDGFKIAIELDAEGRPLARRLFNPDGSLSQEMKSTPEEWLALEVEKQRPLSSPALRAVLQLPSVSAFTSSAEAVLAPIRQTLGAGAPEPSQSIADERGLASIYSFDDFARLARLDNADSGSTWFAYDSGNRLVSRLGADRARTEYRYDDAGRPIAIVTSDATIRIEYDARSQKPKLIRYPAGFETFAYDEQHRIRQRIRNIDGHAFVSRYRYDGAGRLSETTLPDGQVLTYRYNSAASPKPGALSAILRKDLLGSTTIVSGLNEADDRADHQTSMFGNGLPFTRELDVRGQISRFGTKGVAEIVFTSDDAGRIASASTAGAAAQSFAYDEAGRVSGAGYRRFGVAQPALGVAYDDADNVVAKMRGGSVERFVIDDKSNRIAHRLEADGSRTEYSYDSAGRTHEVGERRYRYDAAGLLTHVYEGERLVGQYSYNAFGERIKKVAYSGDRSSVTYFFYDGAKLTAEADGKGEITKQYVYLENRPVAVLIGRDVLALHTDWRGAPLAMTDDNQQLVWRAEAGLWHEAEVALAKVELNLRGSNQYFDAESGLHYNYRRYFDPRAGRYLTPDPIGQQGGLNLYAFVEGDAVNNVDLLGLQTSSNPDGLANNTSVADWSMARRIGYALRVAIPRMPEGIRDALYDLVSTPEAYVAFGAIVLFMASNPAGWVLTAVTAVATVAVALFAWDLIQGIISAVRRVADARCVGDLVSAGGQLATTTSNALVGGVASWLGAGLAARVGRALRGAFDAARRLMPARPPAALPPAPSGTWGLNPFRRGRVIEDELNRRAVAANPANRATPTNNYPVIDRFNRSNGLATSVKSIDLNAATYQTPANLSAKIKEYVDALSGFRGTNWGNLDTTGLIRARELEIAIPRAASSAQQTVINNMIAYARGLNPPVTIRIVIYP